CRTGGDLYALRRPSLSDRSVRSAECCGQCGFEHFSEIATRWLRPTLRMHSAYYAIQPPCLSLLQHLYSIVRWREKRRGPSEKSAARHEPRFRRRSKAGTIKTQWSSYCSPRPSCVPFRCLG